MPAVGAQEDSAHAAWKVFGRRVRCGTLPENSVFVSVV